MSTIIDKLPSSASSLGREEEVEEKGDSNFGATDAGNTETSKLLDGTSSSAPKYNGTKNVTVVDNRPARPRPNSLMERSRLLSYIVNEGLGQGSIVQSVVVAIVIGAVCGIAAYVYYEILFWLLEYIWHTFPETYIVGRVPEWAEIFWIPIVVVVMAFGVGYSVLLLGEPGDLAYTIKCVHGKAFIGMDHVMPMLCASQFSILGGGSLGPEAPLVAICAALAGFVSRKVFDITDRDIIRKHTLMGMSGALAAFFGCPLGGSLFALEVNSRFGNEYYEHTIEAIFCGTLTLAVFRSMTSLPIGPIWSITEEHWDDGLSVKFLVAGACMGLIGAGLAFLFTLFHGKIMTLFGKLQLLDNQNALYRALLGSVFIALLGMWMPHSLFWGEFEFQQVATLAPASSLEHVFPTQGLFGGYELDSFWKCFMLGFAKLIAISFTVAGGYRGGFIFPMFLSGAAFGRALVFLFPEFPPGIACLCFAAGINVAITKTTLATTIILVQLAGQGTAQGPVLAASLVSILTTVYMPFIKTQVARGDLQKGSLHGQRFSPSESGDIRESLTGKKIDDIDVNSQYCRGRRDGW